MQDKELIFNTNFGVANQKEADIPEDAVLFNNHWYKVILEDTIATWEAAKEYCESKNGYLATITSQEENDFLYSYMREAGYSTSMDLGEMHISLDEIHWEKKGVILSKFLS